MGGDAEEDSEQVRPRGPRRLGRATRCLDSWARWQRSEQPEQPLRVAIVGSGPAGLLRGRAPAEEQVASRPQRRRSTCSIACPTPWGLVRARRGARPPEHQGRQPRLREDRRAPGVPLLRQRRARPRHHPRRPARRATTRSSTRSAPRPTAAWASRARTCPAAGPPPSSWPGTTATRTTATSSSTSPRERAVVVGNGNVAADVARMLALTRDELAADRRRRPRARRARRSGREEIVVLGRRGPAQAAFTNPELLELGEMTDADVFVDPRRRRARPAQPAPGSRARPRTPPRARTSRS